MSEQVLRTCTHFRGKFAVENLVNHLTRYTLRIAFTKNPGYVLNMMLLIICSRITEKLECCQQQESPIHIPVIHLPR